MAAVDWSRIINLRRSALSRPDGMQHTIVEALDQFIRIIGSQPQILSDYRPNDLDSQHSKGLAIDAYWPGKDSLSIWNAARASQLFSGLGIYLNEHNVVSFHFDRRTDRTTTKPALWGDFITHDATGSRKDNYTTAEAVLNVIGTVAKSGLPVLALVAALYLIYRLSA